jgi:N-methylhydantoinase A/oxoprolinase/acetone carboxylase beta subunit
VQVGPDRVVPLSRLASRVPRVGKEICALKKKRNLDWRFTDIEYWFVNKRIDPDQLSTVDVRHHPLLELLRDGPLSLTQILAKMDVYHVLQLHAEPLMRQGYLESATLTPTDLLHVNGLMDTWCNETARQAAEFACMLHTKNHDAFVEQTLDLIVAAVVQEAIVFLARQKNENRLSEQVDGAWGRWLIDEAFTGGNPYLTVTIASRYPVIGIGAPAGIFVKQVAESMRAPFILPDHAPVANALGAVAGSVIAEKEAVVFRREIKFAHAHVVQIEGEHSSFLEFEDACAYAENVVTRLALNEAQAAGAANPQVVIEKSTEGHLQRVVARAAGNPKLSQQSKGK